MHFTDIGLAKLTYIKTNDVVYQGIFLHPLVMCVNELSINLKPGAESVAIDRAA